MPSFALVRLIPRHHMARMRAACSHYHIVALAYGVCRFTDYTVIWNMLDYPALVIPVSKVDQTIDIKRPPHAFYGVEDKCNYELCQCYLFLLFFGTYFNSIHRRALDLCKCANLLTGCCSYIGGRSLNCYV